ncbi:hypothetical protein FOCG_18061 [Fusarium oxysporum f. sp. radicis-lycopersici 26381]|nr:hypothetical protein FOCG_18061 [Fusarium oxysporum f. sp. radicis-lycopersici 26381]
MRSTEIALELEDSGRPSVKPISASEENEPPYQAEGTSTSNTAAVARGTEVANTVQYAHGMRLFMIITSLLLTFFTVLLDTSIIATAIPKITDEFGALGDVSWYGSAFLMTMGGTQSAWGKLYKHFSPKMGFLSAVLIFEMASIVCGAAPNSTALIIGRALAGVGAAGVANGTFTIIALIVEPKQLATYTGITAITSAGSAALGPLIGGVLADKLTWRWCFYINPPIGAVAVPFVVFFLRIPAYNTDQKSSERTIRLRDKVMQIDPVGIVLVMGGIIAFIQALHYGGLSKSWSSVTVVSLLVGSVVTGLAFASWEWRQSEHAAIPPRLMANHNIFVQSLYTAFLAGSSFTVIYYLPIYFQSIADVSATMSAVRNLPMIISLNITIIISSVFSSKTGTKPLLVVGAGLATVGCGLLNTLDIGSAAGKWVGYQLLVGIGFGISFQLPIIIAQNTAALADIGPATAIILFFQTVGAAFFLAAAQSAFLNQILLKLRNSAPGVDPATLIATGSAQLRSVFTAEEMPGILTAYMSGLKATFVLATCGSGVAFIVALFSKHKPLSTHTSP